jgi:hypothetical protein
VVARNGVCLSYGAELRARFERADLPAAAGRSLPITVLLRPAAGTRLLRSWYHGPELLYH